MIVGQNYRLTPTFLEARKRILAGDLGTITKIETTYLHDKTQYQQRASANKNKDFLYIGGSHVVDLACWIINEQIIKAQVVSENEFNYKITITFASGLTGNVVLDANLPRPRNGTDLIVTGEKGQLISHNKSDQLIFYKNKSKKPQSINLSNNETLTTAIEVKIVDDYLLGIINSHWPLPDADEALNTMRVLDNIQKKVSL